VEFLLHQPRFNTCRAIDPCTILELSKEDFDSVLQQFPAEVKKTIERSVEPKEMSPNLRISQTIKRKQEEQARTKHETEFREKLNELLKESKSAPREDVIVAVNSILDMIKEAHMLKGKGKKRGDETAVFKGLTLSQLEDAKKAFKDCDLDGNGVIDKDEFFQLVQQITPNMPTLLLKRIADLHFQAADKDGSEAIDEQEFLVVYSDLLKEYSPPEED